MEVLLNKHLKDTLGQQALIHSSEELSKMVCQILLDTDRHEKMTKAARKVVDKNKGALEKLIKLIIPLLKS